MKTLQKMLVVSLLVALASQVNLELLKSDFVVSAGVILFVIFLYHYEEFNPILFGLLSGSMVFVLRVWVHEALFRNINVDVIYSYMPEIIFYIIYSVFFMLFMESKKKNDTIFMFGVFIVCDFASNLIEVFVRYTALGDTELISVVPTLIIVSLIRSAVVWVVLTALNYYSLMLTKKEHEERYKKLLLLTSQLKTEMFWVENSIENIDKLIAQSKKLSEEISSNKNSDRWSDMCLSISQEADIIKRDNALIVRGIKEITEHELHDEGMLYSDIVRILSEAMLDETRMLDKNVVFEFVNNKDFYTYKHYYLMCVLRNVIMNSIDAVRKAQKNAKIKVVHQQKEQQHIFQISDNGSGIHEEYLKNIFSPGFSTKVNNETGEVNRGLGLSVVKYIVEENLKGGIEVSSKEGTGTTTTVIIPTRSLK